MKKKGKAIAAVVVALAAVYGVYHFQTSRITPGQLEDMREANSRVEAAEDVARADALEQADPNADPKAPREYRVRFETTRGEFILDVHRDWAPIGADRFYRLVKEGYYNDNAFFRVVPGFVVQFGLSGNPAVTAFWEDRTLKDEPVNQTNARGTITFAKSSLPNSRTTQVFINYADNTNLDGMGFSPFGEVVKGMDVVEAIDSMHGEDPRQDRIQKYGNEYLKREFPQLDYINRATIVAEGDELPPVDAPQQVESSPAPTPAPAPAAPAPPAEAPPAEEPPAEAPAQS